MIGFDHALESTSEDDDTEDDFIESNVLLNHLRKCFITIDENSYCEHAILPDLKIFKQKFSQNCMDSLDQEQLDSILIKRIQTNAYDYVRVNKTREKRNYKSQTPKILHRVDSYNLGANELKVEPRINETENKQENKKNIFDYDLVVEKSKPPIVSPVTALLKESNEKNEFLTYLKYEAHIQDPSQVQNFRIFLPMCDKEPNENKTFINISIYKSSRISDLIGLICCKYNGDNLEPQLKYKTTDDYNLKIADEYGQIEEEFMPLEANQRVGRFGFSDLAFIEKLESEKSLNKNKLLRELSYNSKIAVIIHFTDDSPERIFEFDSDNILMEEVYDKVFKYKMEDADIFCPKILYKLEHIDQIGIDINLETSYLHDFKNKYEFYFFRQNSVRQRSSPRNSICYQPSETKPDMTRIISKNHEYDVTYLSKWHKVPFKLELSKDNFELEEIKPVQITKLRLSKKQSSFYTIPIKNVVSCSYLKKANDLCEIRIIVAEEEEEEGENKANQKIFYKHLDFECKPDVAEDINTNFSNLIMFCNSQYLKQYGMQVKKTSTKWSRRLFKEKLNSKKTSQL